MSPIPRAAATLAVLACFVAIVPAPAASPAAATCERVVAMGDQHGAYEGFVDLLRAAGILDDGAGWSGGRSCLVQLGDLLDRGPGSRDLLDLLMRLETEAPGRVTVLMGNHEAMNVVGEWTHTVPGEFAAFAAEETPEQREAGYRAFTGMAVVDGRTEDERRREFDERFPPGWFAHREAFGPEGRYGRWILARPVAARIGRSVFVHGGLTPGDAALGIDGLRARVVGDLEEFLRLRDRLDSAGILNPLVPFLESFEVVRLQMRQAVEADPALAASGTYHAAEAYLGLREASFRRLDGPLWNRDFAVGEGREAEEVLEAVLRALDADRIVVGHTVQKSGRIGVRFGGRVFAIDTGASPYFGGRPSALEIEGDVVRARYLDGTEALEEKPAPPGPEAPGDDEQIERFLREADVVRVEEIGTGITKPLRLTLRMDGRTARAAFKDPDIQELNPTRFQVSGTTLVFTDRYVYERAAYLLDRALGMGMVPAAVIRRVNDRTGAVIEWVEDAVSEAERREKDLAVAEPRRLAAQRSVMTVFDALILNEDRNLSNQLITTADGKLHLIDHSRSFRLDKKLPEAFERSPVALTRELHAALGRLNEPALRKTLDGLLSRAQIRALLTRRDRILEKVDRDLEEYGEAFVFLD